MTIINSRRVYAKKQNVSSQALDQKSTHTSFEAKHTKHIHND